MQPRARRDGLLVKPVGDQVVVYDQPRQRLHVLSRTAALVWQYSDGHHAIADLAAAVARDLDAPVDESVILLALQRLGEAHLLEKDLAPAQEVASVSRREMLQRAAGLATAVLLPTITSCDGSPLSPADGLNASSHLVNTTTTTPFNTTTTTPFNTTTTTPLNTTTTTTPLNTTTTTPIVTTTTTTTVPTTTTTTTTTPAPRKVQICHDGRTIEVDEHAVPAHLAHGDTLGPCPS